MTFLVVVVRVALVVVGGRGIELLAVVVEVRFLVFRGEDQRIVGVFVSDRRQGGHCERSLCSG